MLGWSRIHIFLASYAGSISVLNNNFSKSFVFRNLAIMAVRLKNGRSWPSCTYVCKLDILWQYLDLNIFNKNVLRNYVIEE
jgi:hypothetical protein